MPYRGNQLPPDPRCHFFFAAKNKVGAGTALSTRPLFNFLCQLVTRLYYSTVWRVCHIFRKKRGENSRFPFLTAITSLTPRAHSAFKAGLRYKRSAFCPKKQIVEEETLAGFFQTSFVKILHVFCIIACISVWGLLPPRMFLRAFFAEVLCGGGWFLCVW